MKSAVLFISLLVLFLAISCKKSSNNPVLEDAAVDLKGTWIIEQIINSDSQSGTYPQTKIEICTINQSGNSLEVISQYDTSTGQLNGRNLQLTRTFPEGSGKTTIIFSGTASDDGKTFSGTATWTWSDGTSSISGTANISAWKNQNRVMQLTGQWEGTYTSYEGYGNGSFTVSLVQAGTILSGTIDIPNLGIEEEEISGSVLDNCWSFGDINNTISFIGIMGEDSLHFKGNYSYSSYDEGKWEAVRTSSQPVKMLVTINSFPVKGTYGSDIAFDGTNLWVVGDGVIYKYSTAGVLLDSIYSTGNYPRGLTYDGNNLINIDGLWGYKKIFFLSPDEKDVLKIIESGYVTGLAFEDDKIWYLDPSENRICRVSFNGEVQDEITISKDIYQLTGLALADNYLWFCGFDPSNGKTNLYKIDHGGNIISSFIIEDISAGGLTYDGSRLLITSSWEDKILVYNLDGTLYNNYDVNLASPSQVAYDGSNVWLATNTFNPGLSLVYKLNSSYQVIDSIQLPGQNIICLASGNNCIWYFNNGKLIKLNIDGGGYFDTPVTEDLNYLSYYDSKIWALGSEDNLIYNFSSKGENLNSINSPVENSSGISVNNAGIWLIGLDENYKTALYNLSMSGEIIEKINGLISNPTGLIYDGEYFWSIGKKSFADLSFYLFKLKVQ
jgi:hypothetical protein